MPRPGEVSLAHRGVLFFDELPEYSRDILEALRQPLEDRVVTVTRVSATLTYPADFMFVASANPCQCGFLNDPFHICRCSPAAVQRYRSRLSGPLLDRIDIQVEVPRINFEQLQDGRAGESSAAIRSRVEQARALQQNRFKKLRILTNAQMHSRHLAKHCLLTSEARRLLQQAYRAWASPCAPTTASSRWPAPSPTWPARIPSKRPTSPRQSSTAALTGKAEAAAG